MAEKQKHLKLCAWKFGLAGGIISAFFVLVVSILVYFQFAPLVVAMFYDMYGYIAYNSAASVLKAVLGIVYGFVDGFIIAFLLAWVYNMLSK